MVVVIVLLFVVGLGAIGSQTGLFDLPWLRDTPEPEEAYSVIHDGYTQAVPLSSASVLAGTFIRDGYIHFPDVNSVERVTMTFPGAGASNRTVIFEDLIQNYGGLRIPFTSSSFDGFDLSRLTSISLLAVGFGMTPLPPAYSVPFNYALTKAPQISNVGIFSDLTNMSFFMETRIEFGVRHHFLVNGEYWNYNHNLNTFRVSDAPSWRNGAVNSVEVRYSVPFTDNLSRAAYFELEPHEDTPPYVPQPPAALNQEPTGYSIDLFTGTNRPYIHFIVPADVNLNIYLNGYFISAPRDSGLFRLGSSSALNPLGDNFIELFHTWQGQRGPSVFITFNPNTGSVEGQIPPAPPLPPQNVRIMGIGSATILYFDFPPGDTLIGSISINGNDFFRLYNGNDFFQVANHTQWRLSQFNTINVRIFDIITRQYSGVVTVTHDATPATPQAPQNVLVTLREGRHNGILSSWLTITFDRPPAGFTVLVSINGSDDVVLHEFPGMLNVRHSSFYWSDDFKNAISVSFQCNETLLRSDVTTVEFDQHEEKGGNFLTSIGALVGGGAVAGVVLIVVCLLVLKKMRLI